MEHKLASAEENAYATCGVGETTAGCRRLPGKAGRQIRLRCQRTGGDNRQPFEEPKYEVTFSVIGGNGTLTAAVDGDTIVSQDAVEKGKTVLFTAAPDEGYRVKEWIVDAVTAEETGLTLTLENLESEKTVTVEFEKKTYTVTFIGWENTVLSTQVVEHGGSATAPAVPPVEGYAFIGWDLAFTNVVSNLTVTAQYEEAVGPVQNENQDKWYHTIQAAINEAASGDTIVATAGTYNESLTIDKDITSGASAVTRTWPGPVRMLQCWTVLAWVGERHHPGYRRFKRDH